MIWRSCRWKFGEEGEEKESRSRRGWVERRERMEETSETSLERHGSSRAPEGPWDESIAGK